MMKSLVRPSLPKVTATPRLLNLTPESYVKGLATAGAMPNIKSARGRRLGRKARRKMRRQAKKARKG